MKCARLKLQARAKPSRWPRRVLKKPTRSEHLVSCTYHTTVSMAARKCSTSKKPVRACVRACVRRPRSKSLWPHAIVVAKIIDYVHPRVATINVVTTNAKRRQKNTQFKPQRSKLFRVVRKAIKRRVVKIENTNMLRDMQILLLNRHAKPSL
jgi:hypothetical protein